ncbi:MULTISPECIES: hypothetical protein [unclassified Paenibacillus]
MEEEIQNTLLALCEWIRKATVNPTPEELVALPEVVEATAVLYDKL